MRNFYNTINLTGEKLQKANARALAQEELIREIFNQNPALEISPSQMEKLFRAKYGRHHPITSIRRALTNLTYEKHGKFLTKTAIQIVGEYGLPEHLWCKTATANSFVPPTKQQTIF